MVSHAVAVVEEFRSAENLLGGRAVLGVKPRSRLDWIEVIRRGIPARAVESLQEKVKLSQVELARILGIPERTLARRKREGVLTAEESAKLLRLARVFGRADEVFEDADAALDWLRSSNASLAGKTPLGLLDTEIGSEAVLDILGRIEHGVFG
ncbi:MAG: type II RES/Xre toxin-antitoxin system antitoxin [Woeseiaceae bacterium]